MLYQTSIYLPNLTIICPEDNLKLTISINSLFDLTNSISITILTRLRISVCSISEHHGALKILIDWNNVHLCKQTRYLGLIGGHNKYDVTRRIMRALMTNDLARKLNFAGRGNKQGIKDLKILSVIIGL